MEFLMKTWTETHLERVVEDVMSRAAIDPEFRALAIAEPTKALAKFDPTPLPPTLRFSFVEGDSLAPAEANEFQHTVVLPEPMWANLQLSDMELEEVAGGGCLLTCCGAPAVVAQLAVAP